MNALLHDTFGDRLEIYPDREAWLAARTAHRIGGSDVPAILGVSAWASPWTVYRRKALGIAEEITPEKQALFDRGHAAEPCVLADYALTTGNELLPHLECCVRHPEHDWLVGSPDGFTVDPDLGLIGVEAKSAERTDGWIEAEGTADVLDEDAPPWVEIRPGDDGAGLLPDTYLFQVLTYLECTGLRAWDCHLVAVPFGWWETVAELARHVPWTRIRELAPERGIHRRTVRVLRDPEAQAQLLDRVGAWRQRHLVEGHEPDIDGSDGCRDHLRDQHGAPPDKRIRPATDEEATLVRRLHGLGGARKKIEAEEAEVKNRLRAALGETYGVIGGGLKCTRSVVAGRTTVDSKALAASWPEAFEACAKQGNSYDQFRISIPK